MQANMTLTISTNPFWKVMNRIEHFAGFGMLVCLAIIPVLDAILRSFFHSGVPYGTSFLDALIIPITFIGMALASKEKRHMAIAVNVSERTGTVASLARHLIALFSGLVVGMLLWTSIEFIFIGFDMNESILLIPIIVFLIFFPLGMFMMVVRTFPRTLGTLAKLLYIAGFLFSIVAACGSIAIVLEKYAGIPQAVFGLDLLDQSWWHTMMSAIKMPMVVILVICAFVGAPLYMVLGGLAIFLLGGEGMTGNFGFSDGINLIRNGSYIPAIALFTLAGYLLSESQAVNRMIKLFQGLFGKLPGGIVIVVVIISAFFTSFTGGSGITILALGAILLAILQNSGGNSERFSVGLITSTGAIGVLFPPSLAIIIYGSVELSSLGTVAGAQPVNILQIFEAAAIPGLLFVIAMIVMGALMSRREKGHRAAIEMPKMSGTELRRALMDSLPELLLPVLVILVFFTGIAGIVESAAFAAVYAFVVEVIIKKEISFKKLIDLSVHTLIIFGGILAILIFGRGLSSFVVFTGFDQSLVDWAQATIKSPMLFLFLLNIVLLIAGSLMEIYTSIVIFVPLLTLVAASFGISQAHLAVIFLANMSIGFMMPPVGMDLFLASFRFQRPMIKVYRDILPFFAVQFLVLMLITYVPWFSTVLVK